MRVFLDTNLLIDVLELRQPFCATSQDVLDRCDALGADVFIAWHGLATAYYIHSRSVGEERAQEAMTEILDAAVVATVGDAEAHRAIELGFADFEDAMQTAAAEACAADVLVTRDPKGFVQSPLIVLSPEDFLLQRTQPA